MKPIGAGVWFVDCEWGYRSDRIGMHSAFEPVVWCAINSRTGHRLSFWGRDLGLAAFIAEHRDDTFASHSNQAEMKYLHLLGIAIPPNWFDTYVGWRHFNNRPKELEGGLVWALSKLGLPYPIEKEEMRKKILHLRFDPNSEVDRQEIINYCFGDCLGCGRLYEFLVGKVDSVAMSLWVEYLKVVALIELGGIKFDLKLYRAILNSRDQITEFLIEKVNAVAPLYKEGVFRRRAFLQWAKSEGIEWPWCRSKHSGKMFQSISDKVMKSMETRHRYIALVRQVRKTISSFSRRTFRIEKKTKLHYYSVWPFRSITGRNQPRDFVFTGPKWLRFLMVPESRDHLLVYVDFVAQEVGIAAALSGDVNMKRMYESEDAHLAFARMANALPDGITEETREKIRDMYKTVSLGSLYGQTEHGVADRTGMELGEAKAVLNQHRELFADFWRWSRRTVEGAYRRKIIRTQLGWSCRVPKDSNFRTWMNWPIQSAGGDLMRMVVIYLNQAGVRVLAPVHDGFLLSCRRDQLQDLKKAVDVAFGLACDQVLGYRLRWDYKVFGGRFQERKGREVWELILSALRALNRD